MLQRAARDDGAEGLREAISGLRGGRLYTVREVALLLRRHPETVRRWVRRGFLKAHRLPTGGYLIEEAEVRGLLEAGA
jgi:excisionase family DNA binding protein